MQTRKLLLKLFEYKGWANADLYTLMHSLKSDLHARELHDAIRILNHIYVVDQIFVANLQGKRHGYTSLNTKETPALRDLQLGVQVVDEWYVAYVAAQTEIGFAEDIDFTFVDGKPGRMSRGEMLLHVATHGNYHRGAVGRILFQAGIQPPKDTLTVFMGQQAAYLP
ncbi:DinB family protein [Undibacterium umbellatum]|uniref:DinB family protein n=1 Tax=Undibacterium umbellatum TaxID=2762300 RepID=A0ABR6ZAM5_9BURK|nr:DinB family protein [Undibacterium umbellatum]MBC3908380.1 DinB family protein [Undibacterium umbellatum]